MTDWGTRYGNEGTTSDASFNGCHVLRLIATREADRQASHTVIVRSLSHAADSARRVQRTGRAGIH